MKPIEDATFVRIWKRTEKRKNRQIAISLQWICYSILLPLGPSPIASNSPGGLHFSRANYRWNIADGRWNCATNELFAKANFSFDSFYQFIGRISGV